jgi:hypothetical protein
VLVFKSYLFISQVVNLFLHNEGGKDKSDTDHQLQTDVELSETLFGAMSSGYRFM